MSYFSDPGYIDYWKDRVGRAIDGSKVAGPEAVGFFLAQAGVTPSQRGLDLGCSFGRMFPVLSQFAEQLDGTDVTEEALVQARQHAYHELRLGQAESLPFEADRFDLVVAWGVFDVVEQERGFAEANRVLKVGGKFLVTGKHNDYLQSDSMAFVAERNAYLKKFPNHFTDLDRLLPQLDQFGFSLAKGFGFPNRGDFGEGRFFELGPQSPRQFYEFLLVLEKIETKPLPEGLEICGPSSRTALMRAHLSGFSSLEELFLDHQKKCPNG
ncbi:MAG: hypothetical protein A2600_10740 [Candidatus Lambdaproteobacteria bacterium RIFOXYD1_FULL_56_27]|uniref:Methyltransferase type 11 domain-containing protein n=1 Tax=Candidatus Lambdaproteobacteria bacterium RIFOXYD2_FULL_56_26 TaxID=1817773 RepID=A0A1F6GV50_9PROT|nr:MAG: hypothetical protein A2426_01560 [Candidatus Lambdaproteobacteria bacterium RIFOXYC1_FULL_56_13]OGH02056.1 MAG: hypothetical protein A2557_10460 [Candidatus Lambdaproteobacteria bacterium RIFOXYD2_FULL_56_26]OGH07706.1 MAG: hypothetical protein A2600_10740 [Candidatus Lambdaproteobacteria bacterium RIFOXYD1_FULL_56_27]